MSAPPVERIRELQQRVRRMEGVGIEQELELLPALAEVMSVKTGSVCSVDSPGLALALAAGASRSGAWIGFCGLPEVGWEAAAELGLDLDRTVAVPFPGEHWLSVSAALVDVVGVVIARPPGRVPEAQAARLSARLRQRGAVLIVDGNWPRASVRLSTLRNRWTGLAVGHGHLRRREVQVAIGTAASAPQVITWELSAGLVSLLEPSGIPDVAPVSELGSDVVSAMVG